MIKFIIFSKDRPAQLDRLLRSIEEYYPECDYSVIVKSDPHQLNMWRGYKDDCFTDKRVFEQEDFKDDVLYNLTDQCTCFLVDDMQFVDRFRAAGREYYHFLESEDIACLSLRMHPGIRYSYTKDIDLTPPLFEDGFIKWPWKGLKSYWGYPMSLDGHIFKTEDIKPLIEKAEFNNPNELEMVLARAGLPKPYMMCYNKPRVINYPLNLVQDTCLNRSMNIDPELLNDSFLGGHRLALQYPEIHDSCHMELEPVWI